MRDKGICAKLYRVERWFYCHHLKIISHLIYRMIQILFSCVIPPSCQIDKGLHIAHGIGIVLHHNLKIGSNCTIYQNVTIGGSDKIEIGNNVKIGALTFVNFDIEDGYTVVGNKGKKNGGKNSEG